MTTARDTAHLLQIHGINALPTKTGAKHPALATWKIYQSTHITTTDIDRWWSTATHTGIWVATGQVSRLIVLDIDSPAAEEYWRCLIGSEMDKTTATKTNKGHHYWFRLDDTPCRSWRHADSEIRYDVQADGKGAMAPPSPHPNGGYYEWVRDITHLQPAPTTLLSPDGHHGQDTRIVKSHESPGATEHTPSLLSTLLGQAPDSPDSGNDWLARVAGHLASYQLPRDAYTSLVHRVNSSLAQPLTNLASQRLADSIWDGHMQRHQDPLDLHTQPPANIDTGWLTGTGSQLLALCLEDHLEVYQPYANCDIKLTSTTINPDNSRTYQLTLTGLERSTSATVPASTFGNSLKLSSWLAGYGYSIIPPANDPHRRTSTASRISRYIDTQTAPTLITVPHLGWHHDSQAFLTADQQITANGPAPLDRYTPDPNITLHNWTRQHYGYQPSPDDSPPLDYTLKLLREILTYHDPTVTNVFAAWAITTLIKGNIMPYIDSYPIMAVESPSETGKSTGFFPLLMQLIGNRGGNSQLTRAAMRDSLSANRSGITWIDDITDITEIEEIIRQVTVEGSMIKKGIDNTGSTDAQLVGTLVLSAESLDHLHREKALLDRCIILDVPTPVNRRSTHDPSRSQWDDITDIRIAHNNDLTGYAGHLLQHTLHLLPRHLHTLTAAAHGRNGSKCSILQLGAHLLADMLDDPSIIDRVQDWTNTTPHTATTHNTLVLDIIPSYLTSNTVQHTAIGSPPIWISGEDMWISESLLADWWAKRSRLDPRRLQTGSIGSIRQQRIAICKVQTATRHTTSYPDAPRSQASYWPVPADISRQIQDDIGLYVQ